MAQPKKRHARPTACLECKDLWLCRAMKGMKQVSRKIVSNPLYFVPAARPAQMPANIIVFVS